VLSLSLSFAPRISPRLLTALLALDDPTLPFAEINRRLGVEADRLRLARPSYQRIRVLLHAARRFRRERRQPSTVRVLLDIYSRVRPPMALIDHLYGASLPPLPP
jgi:hypothetical protein